MNVLHTEDVPRCLQKEILSDFFGGGGDKTPNCWILYLSLSYSICVSLTMLFVMHVIFQLHVRFSVFSPIFYYSFFHFCNFSLFSIFCQWTLFFLVLPPQAFAVACQNKSKASLSTVLVVLSAPIVKFSLVLGIDSQHLGIVKTLVNMCILPLTDRWPLQSKIVHLMLICALVALVCVLEVHRASHLSLYSSIGCT